MNIFMIGVAIGIVIVFIYLWISVDGDEYVEIKYMSVDGDKHVEIKYMDNPMVQLENEELKQALEHQTRENYNLLKVIEDDRRKRNARTN